jgi:AAA domain
MRWQPFSELTPRSIAWLWPQRLAYSKLALLEGDPGLGKSLVALDLCARLSTGRPLPDGQPSPEPVTVLVLSSEDVAEETILKRLEAFGADIKRVIHMPREVDDAPALLFPAQIQELDDALTRTKARLVVIDLIVDFLEPRINVNSDKSVRSALLPLARLAEKHQCVILLLRHLNKDGRWRSIYRGSGAIGFIGACRSAWLVAADPNDADRCVLAQVKNNLAARQPSLVYQVVEQEGAPPQLNWLGPCDWTADQLLAGATAPATGSPRDRAKEFLTELLANGPVTSRAVWEAAQAEGLAKRTLDRAKEDLEIQSGRVWDGEKQVVYWLRKGQELPRPEPPKGMPDLEPWFERLREHFPPANPLDEG